MGGSGGGGKGFEPFEDKEIKFRYRNSPLFNAILANDLTEFQKALDSGMNVNARNRERWTPLYLAIDAQNPIMVRSLLEKGAKIDDKVGSQTPIMFAVDFLTLTLNSNTKDARDIVRIL
ncbi:MAG: ankyrin repeat domain-containing protein, partial [Candidatus Micrarchaeota archaeon]|nr:ankyrin repeat domain-containing protein [Candidatus Micrarchaeota archaeon]